MKRTGYISFHGGISTTNVNQLIVHCIQTINGSNPADSIYLLLSSLGGSVQAGITLYNFIKGLHVPVTTHNIGTVDSIANVVFLAGDERFAVPTSSFLFHGARSTLNGSFLHPELLERVRSLDSDNQKMKNIIVKESSLTKKKAADWLSQGETISPQTAQKNRLIDDIRELQIPAGCNVVTVNTQ